MLLTIRINTVVDAHYLNIKEDITWNLRRVMTDPAVRHEESTYGYYSRFLNVIFPPNRGFQVRQFRQSPHCGFTNVGSFSLYPIPDVPAVGSVGYS